MKEEHLKDQELEVKFYLQDLDWLETRLREIGAQLVQSRVLEKNLRFDTADGELSRTYRVLRLRKDQGIHLTYKGPGKVQDEVRARQEIELEIDDFDSARSLFENLGYQVRVIYEKFRAVYAWEKLLVTLDEMPYGKFAEIEGPGGESIRMLADKLGLDWDRRILDSYLLLFEKARSAMGFTFRDLTFENFKGIQVPFETLGVKPAMVK